MGKQPFSTTRTNATLDTVGCHAPPMARIVIATDLSESSRPAFQAGVGLAKDLGLGIALVHAFPPTRAGLGIAGGAVQRDIQLVREETAMDDAVAMSETWLQAARDGGLDATGVSETGDAADLVIEAAELARAPFIVVGTHGRSGLSRALLGSVAEAIVRRSDRPVLVVPANKA